jgi:hypothetical protein
MHASPVATHVFSTREPRSALRARLHISRSQVPELQPTFVLLVPEIAMRVLQQILALRVVIIIS